MKKGILLLLAIFSSIFYVSNQLNAVAIIIPVEKNVLIKKPDPATVKAAIDEFKNLPRKEKKEKIREVKNEIRKFKAAKRDGGQVDTNTLLLVILAILLPPLAVYLHEGETNNKFWITLILFLAGIAGVFLLGWYAWLASVIYALVVVLGGDK